MSENIEKAVQTEESSETIVTEAPDGKTADYTNKFSETQNTKESSPKDA